MCYIIQKIEENLRNLLHSLLCWLSDEGCKRPKFGISIERVLLFIPDGRSEGSCSSVHVHIYNDIVFTRTIYICINGH